MKVEVDEAWLRVKNQHSAAQASLDAQMQVLLSEHQMGKA
jgi:hypothetical protein